MQCRMIKISLKKLVQIHFTPHLEIEKLRRDDCLNPSSSAKKHCHVESLLIDDINCFKITPKKFHSEKILLSFHGGAYACGPSLLHWRMISQLSFKLGCRSIIVKYKRTPEYAYPAAMDDMLKVYTSLLLENKPENIIFIGDSAGGGLALTTAMKLRDEHKPLPLKLVLLSPWLDLSMDNAAIEELEDLDQMLALPGLKEAASLYGGTNDLKNPYISPIYGNLDGLPPTLLLIGTDDLLLADCRKFKNKSEQSNYRLKYQEWDEMFHVWMLNVPYLPEANKALEEIETFIQNE